MVDIIIAYAVTTACVSVSVSVSVFIQLLSLQPTLLLIKSTVHEYVTAYITYVSAIKYHTMFLFLLRDFLCIDYYANMEELYDVFSKTIS